jgi:MFS family permease
LKDVRVIMAFLACMIAIMNVSFMEPIISLRVIEFGFNAEVSGFLFTAMTIPYIIACPFVLKAIKRWPKRNIMVTAFIIITIFSTMFGPSKIL